MFLSLLPEIQEHILSYSCIVDLKNLAVTSSQCYHVLKEYLSHTVRVTEDILGRNKFLTDRKLKKMLNKLSHTKVLHVSAYRHGLPKPFYMSISRLDQLQILICVGVLLLKIQTSEHFVQD